MNAHRLTLLLFAILLTACGADHRARNLLKQYQAAAEKNDIPTLVRLGDPNMRALIERHYEEPNYPSNAIQQILPHPVRVVRHPHGIAYIGWVGSDLVPIVVGEGRATSKYSSWVEHASVNDTTDWQVSILDPGMLGAFICRMKNADPAPYNAALMQIDDALLSAWLFEGSLDAKQEIHRRMDL